MKRVIMLDNGARVEVNGSEVKHIDANGNVLYDTVKVSHVKAQNVWGFPYFFLMGEVERKKVAEWFDQVSLKVNKEKSRQYEFLNRVEDALKVIDYDYYIATIESSFDEDGNIFYEEGNPVARGISLFEWEKKSTAFFSVGGWHSELAMLEEGDLFKAYRIAMGYWTIEYVCDDSSLFGNYWNAPKSAHGIEVSGAREVGGFKDGIGNTYEVYQTKSGLVLVGGYYCNDGDILPVSYIHYNYDPNRINFNASGVLVLKRSTVQ